jgi:hypothetical protein
VYVCVFLCLCVSTFSRYLCYGTFYTKNFFVSI